jgi:steroid delta-isomerase-like uncharacterized protein
MAATTGRSKVVRREAKPRQAAMSDKGSVLREVAGSSEAAHRFRDSGLMGGDTMSIKENKAIFRQIVEEGYNKGNLAIVDELVAANHVNHADDVRGPEEYKQFITMYRTAFPDLHMTIEDQIAEGDKVVNRWMSRGTHKGDLMGIPPTGKHVTVTGMYVARIIGGKITEEWGNFDALGMMQQLGVVPSPGQAEG